MKRKMTLDFGEKNSTDKMQDKNGNSILKEYLDSQASENASKSQLTVETE